MRRALVSIVVVSGAFFLSGCASKYFYYPTRQVYQTPAQKGLRYDEVTFTSKDGTKLKGWFIPSVGPPAGTIIHFHGNAQNMTAHLSFVDWLPQEGYHLFIFDYRGYGQSHGRPSRRGVYQDSVAAIKYVKSRKDVNPERLLVLGQSLGGANAIAAMGHNRMEGVRAVAIEATFYSYRQIVRENLAKIPVVSLLRWPLSFLVIGNGYSPGKVVDDIAPIPLLLIHGSADRVIPIHHGNQLFKKAKEPKQFWQVKKGRHTEAFTTYGHKYREVLLNFFREALANGAEEVEMQSIPCKR